MTGNWIDTLYVYDVDLLSVICNIAAKNAVIGPKRNDGLFEA